MDIALQRLRSPDYSAAVSAAELKPVVAELRRQRCGMVQTPEQYHFCYQVSLLDRSTDGCVFVLCCVVGPG